MKKSKKIENNLTKNLITFLKKIFVIFKNPINFVKKLFKLEILCKYNLPD